MKTRTILLLAIAAAVLAVWLPRVTYRVADDSRAQLLCNAHECYLFIGTNKVGWRLTNLQVVESFFREALGGATYPTHGRAQALVFTLTKQGIARYSFPGTLDPFQVYRNSLYVQYLKIASRSDIHRTNGNLRPEDHCFCRWTGHGLEEITPEEAKAVYAAKRTLMVGSSADGWSWNYVNSDSTVHATVDGADLFITLHGDQRSAGSLTVRRATEPGEQTLWSGDGTPRRVSREDYQRMFGP